MTLTDEQAHALAVRLGALPQMAADSLVKDTPSGAGGRREGKPGSKPPPGVDLDANLTEALPSIESA